MIGFDGDFEKRCEEYLRYLYRLSEKDYSDCPEIDGLVQDTLAALFLKVRKGETVEHPKGFLSAVLKNKYNAWLRQKYKGEWVVYTDGVTFGDGSDLSELED